MSTTAHISRTAEIAGGLQSKFPAHNYGYAGAIRTGKIIVENGRLVIKTPQLSLDSRLPFYTCDSASALAAQELNRNDIHAFSVHLTIPMSPEENGTIGHTVCLAHEGQFSYLVGLATPIDKFLGLYPCANLDDADWVIDHLNRKNGQFFFSPPKAEIFEEPTWRLSGFDPRIRPLLAKNLPDGRLAIADLGLGAVSGVLCLALVTRIIRFDADSKKAVIEWNDHLFLKIAGRELSGVQDEISRFRNHPRELREALERAERLYRTNNIQSAALSDEGEALINDAWPSVVELLIKLPADDVKAAISSNAI